MGSKQLQTIHIYGDTSRASENLYFHLATPAEMHPSFRQVKDGRLRDGEIGTQLPCRPTFLPPSDVEAS